MNADYVRLFKSLSSKISEHAKWVDAIVAAREVHLNDQFNLVGFHQTFYYLLIFLFVLKD